MTRSAPATRTGIGTGFDALAKIGAILPATLYALFGPTGIGLAWLLALSLGLLFACARPRPAQTLAVVLGTPVFIGAFAIVLALWADAEGVPETDVYWRGGIWTLTRPGLLSGLTTGTRLGTVIMLALFVGATTSARDLIRAMIAHTPLSYRVGYAILIGARFAPRTRSELRLIRQAHALRGYNQGRGPVQAVRRGLAYLPPLAASGVRQASRVALAMDARAFGALPARTERDPARFRTRDAVLVIVVWTATAAAVCAGL